MGRLVRSFTFTVVVAALAACAQPPGSGRLDVEGMVVGLLDEPVAGVHVSIGGVTTTTDADGRFVVPNVEVPYDLVVYHHGAQSFAHVFVGMTRANPTILPSGAIELSFAYPSGAIEGTLPAPLAVGERAVICAEGLAIRTFGCDVLDDPTVDEYELTVGWATGASANVRLHALLAEVGAQGYPTGYVGYGTTTGSVSDGGTSVLDVAAYTPMPGTVPISGTIAAPLGLSIGAVLGAVRLSDDYVLPVFWTDGGGPTFDAVMPGIGEATYQVIALADGPIGASIAWLTDVDGGEPLEITLPAPLVHVSPPGDSTGITSATPFTVAGAPGLARTFVFRHETIDFAIAVTTMADTVTIPSLGALGFGLPAGAEFTWSVIASTTATTMDEAGHGWAGAYYAAFIAATTGGPGADVDGAIVSSGARTFETE